MLVYRVDGPDLEELVKPQRPGKEKFYIVRWPIGKHFYILKRGLNWILNSGKCN